MDVNLYVYDLSRGMARQLSMQFLGIQIDAVYHTSIVLEGFEYFFGAGIQSCRAGTTHHGRPMQQLRLGRTELPIELILEYLDSLRSIYTAESYDLFLHNCNNFSNDFAVFLTGQGIPNHITSLPQTVLNTPFGQMLKPALDREMRSITQAAVPSQQATPLSNGHSEQTKPRAGVRNITSLTELENALSSAAKSCAVVFFTSSTCAPCKVLYPTYDALAEEAGGKAVLIKVDINFAREIAAKYKVQATPTIMTFLKGKKDEEWAGADVVRLRTTVQLLIQSAHPRHPHSDLEVSRLLSAAEKPIKYTKIPPLDKLKVKLGQFATHPVVTRMHNFITTSTADDTIKQENPLPDLSPLISLLETTLTDLPTPSLFAAYDLLRISLIDFRVAAFFSSPPHSTTLLHLLSHVNALATTAPYSLRIVSLHLACNLLAPPHSSHILLAQPALTTALLALLTNCLLDPDHDNVRVAAASLAFNVAAALHRHRIGSTSQGEADDLLPPETQIELVAAVLEALSKPDEKKETVVGLVLALALVVYCAPMPTTTEEGGGGGGGEVVDLVRVMDVGGILAAKAGVLDGEGACAAAVEVLTKGLMMK